MLPTSPHYAELAPSIPSDDDASLEDLHTAPTRMTVDEDHDAAKTAELEKLKGVEASNSSGDAGKGTQYDETLANQVREQGRTIDELMTKVNKFMEYVMANAPTAPGTPRRMADPQEAELLAGGVTNVNDKTWAHKPDQWSRLLVLLMQHHRRAC